MHKIPIDIDRLKELLHQGLRVADIVEQTGWKRGTIRKRMAKHGLKSCFKLCWTPEQKKAISERRRQWNRDNPELVREKMIRWAKSKNRSVPCERLKDWLKGQNISFIEEFQPLRERGRFFSIDIAFPDKLIGIEVNGNQHYESDGTLKPRYKERHEMIEAAGWTLYEVHYPICFKPEALEKMIQLILASDKRVDFDYGTYKPPLKKHMRKHAIGDNSWRRKPRPKARRCIHPSREVLQKLVWTKSVVSVGQDFGVSGTAVKRWCVKEGIAVPPPGYWAKRHAGQSHEQAIEMVGPPGLEPGTRDS